MKNTLSASEMISYSTVRIECIYKNGSKGTGTGFFFNFLENKLDGKYVPVIVTNKHVINGAERGVFIFTTADENGNPIDDKHYAAQFQNFEAFWRKHPDADVDLCAIPIAQIIEDSKTKGKEIYFVPLTRDLIPNLETLEDMNALEEILMVGYPNGIWDNINNKPIFRRGITASHPKLDYCGKKEVMIDAACFPGSSGSPVFIFNQGFFKTKTGRLSAGDRIILLGILYAGPQHVAHGEIKVINVPTSQIPIALSSIPNNLGLVIKSERLYELESIFEKEANGL